MMGRLLKFTIYAVLASFLAGCYTTRPEYVENICDVFYQYPSWYWAAKKTQDKWGVPIPVQMAIMYQESTFQANAAPPAREKLLSIIPWNRKSTAFGYSQALQHTWEGYQASTGTPGSERDDFYNATDFIGWYSNQVQKYLHIPPTDGYNLYLAYHEGMGGYHLRTYWHKPMLIRAAHGVETRSYIYAKQLKQCEQYIPKPLY